MDCTIRAFASRTSPLRPRLFHCAALVMVGALGCGGSGGEGPAADTSSVDVPAELTEQDVAWNDLLGRDAPIEDSIGDTQDAVPETSSNDLLDSDSCTPACHDRNCGDDGCGGTCGQCTDGKVCSPSGACVEVFPRVCRGISEPSGYNCGPYTAVGCCDLNNKLLWCEGGALYCSDCMEGGTAADQACGWDTEGSSYNCGQTGEDPLGVHPLLCGPVPGCDCGSKECGDDGCGGSCGECTGGKVCQAGTCKCATQSRKGCCNGGEAVCWYDSCGAMGDKVEDCPWGCNEGTCNSCPRQCDGKQCGDDGCGGACGSCAVASCDGLKWTPAATCSTEGTCIPSTAKDCDDGSTCTTDSCYTTAGCVNNPLADGTICVSGSCADGIWTRPVKCSAGQCTEGRGTEQCIDGNLCTDDLCSPTQGCAYPNNTVPCDDSDPCTTGDACAGGSCHGLGTLSCDDENSCTRDWCLEGFGCRHEATGEGQECAAGSCSGLSWTKPGTCAVGTCLAGAVVSCDDTLSCTTDSCSPSGGCTNSLQATKCLIDGECYGGGQALETDACKVCAVSNTQTAWSDRDCNDGLSCTNDSCDEDLGCQNVLQIGFCIIEGSCHADGEANPANPCAVCDAAADTAAWTSLADGSTCVAASCNGLSWTSARTCLAGQCSAGGNTTSCDDDKACTLDSCSLTGCTNQLEAGRCLIDGACYLDDASNPGNSCQFCDAQGIPNTWMPVTDGTSCDLDSSACTPDTCQVGTCEAGTPLPEGSPCSDSDECTGSDACDAFGACVPGAVKSCDDGNECTVDRCEPATGNCLYDPVAQGTSCDDDLFCTVGDVCDGQGTCSGTSRDCTEGGCVSSATCDESIDECNGSFMPDGTLCNADSDGCTKNDYCTAGKCQAGAAVNCGLAGDWCNTYTCQPTGVTTYLCAATPAPAGAYCDDNLFCTVGETCNGQGRCTGGTQRDCSALSTACATGTCSEGTDSCIPTLKNDGTACDDEDACSSGTVCKAGFCVAGTNVCGDEDVKVTIRRSSVSGPSIAGLQRDQVVAVWSNAEGYNSVQVADDLSRIYQETQSVLDLSSPSVISTFTGRTSVASPASTPWTNQDYLDAYTDWNYWQNKAVSGCTVTTDRPWCCTYDPGEGVLYPPWDHRGCILGSSVPDWGSRTTCACLRTNYQIAKFHYGVNIANFESSSGSTTGSFYKRSGYANNLSLGVAASALLVSNDVEVFEVEWGNVAEQVRGPSSQQYATGFADGSFVAVWIANGNVRAQKYAATLATDGTEFQANTSTGNNPQNPRVLALPNGRYLIYWEISDNGGDIHAQLFRSEPGAKIGNEFTVQTSLAGVQNHARAAVFPDSSFVVVWEDQNGRDGDGNGIVGRWFSASAVPLTGEKVLNLGWTGNQHLPEITTNTSGDYVSVLWRNEATGHLYMRRFDRLGKADNGIKEGLANTVKTGQQSMVAGAAPIPISGEQGDASFWLAWASDQADGNGLGIVARSYAAQGTPVGGEFRVNTYSTGDQQLPDLSMDRSGNVVLVWQSYGQDGDVEGVYGVRYQNDGTKVGSEFSLATVTANEQLRPRVAVQPNGSFAAVWETYGMPGGAGYDAVIRCFDSSGGAIGTEALVNTFTTNSQVRPRIAAYPSGSGLYAVVWQSYDQVATGSDYDVYVRLYNSNCAAVTDPTRVNVTTTGIQSEPVVAVDLEGQVSIAWQSSTGDGSGSGIYMRRFANDGSSSGESRVNRSTAGDQTLPSVSILPNRNILVAWQTAGEDEDGLAVKATQFDAAGTELALEWMANRTTAGDQGAPRIIGRTNGTWLTAWTSQGQDGSGGGIVFRPSNNGDCFNDADCNDQNVCTTDTCVEGKCRLVNNTNPCSSDGNACTENDTCLNGSCQGTPKTCSDDNVCTTDFCDATTGECLFAGIPGCNGGCFFSTAPGCGSCRCETNVCAEMPECCLVNWSSQCVSLCTLKYGGCDSASSK